MSDKERTNDVYYLFGAHPCAVLISYGIDILVDRIKEGGVVFGLFHWTPDTHPSELLNEFSGWEDYSVITSKDYDALAGV